MESSELKELRIRLGLTQAELAGAIGVAPNTFARWERGELGIPTWAVDRLNSAAHSGSSGSAVTRPRGVILDPHHGMILAGLNGDLNPEAFESCAADLLQSVWPGLVPIRGGQDDGFDGAIAEGVRQEPLPSRHDIGKRLDAQPATEYPTGITPGSYRRPCAVRDIATSHATPTAQVEGGDPAS